MIKIADFGFAKEVPTHENLQMTKNKGTPLYLAPEIMFRENAVNYKMDIWSLGCIFYALVCKNVPFYSTEWDELVRRIKAGSYFFPQNIDISFNFLDLIQSCLKFDKEQRLDI